MGNFTFTNTSIPDVKLVTAKLFSDNRGFFLELFSRNDFYGIGAHHQLQDNCSYSKRGVIRGLHYQLMPSEIGKLVYCISGSILDVAVDIRDGSPTFGKHVAAPLSAPGEDSENLNMLWVPPGFAHGFQAIEDSIVIYKQSGYYSPKQERSIAWNDRDLNISWEDIDPILSDKDLTASAFIDLDTNFTWRPNSRK